MTKTSIVPQLIEVIETGKTEYEIEQLCETKIKSAKTFTRK